MELTPEQKKYSDEQAKCIHLLDYIVSEFDTSRDIELTPDQKMNIRLEATCAFLKEIDSICTTEKSVDSARRLVYDLFFNENIRNHE